MESDEIVFINLISTCQDLDVATIRQWRRHYAMHGAERTVKILVWSAYRVLALCEDSLRDKVRAELSG